MNTRTLTVRADTWRNLPAHASPAFFSFIVDPQRCVALISYYLRQSNNFFLIEYYFRSSSTHRDLYSGNCQCSATVTNDVKPITLQRQQDRNWKFISVGG
jgi:hypothetical protein